MIKKIQKNSEIFALSLLMIITVISTTYYNYDKNKIYSNYKNIINNVYLKKTINHIFNNLEPRFKKISHKIKDGETFDKILESYSVSNKEIKKIKKSLQNKVNINKLNTKQIIQFSIDKTNNKITEFIFQISNTQKILLERNIKNDKFNEEILSIKFSSR